MKRKKTDFAPKKVVIDGKKYLDITNQMTEPEEYAIQSGKDEYGSHLFKDWGNFEDWERN